MSNYTKSTNFATKDNLPTNDPAKIIKGTEIDNEFNAIASAVASKADLSSPSFTGTPTAPTAAPGTNSTQVATTAFVAASVGTVSNIAGGGQNRVVYQSAADTTAFAPAPTVAGTYLGWTGSAFAWSTVSASTSAALTINNSGSGASSGATFNGSLPVTISYNTVGAPSTSGAGATGTWGINITGSSGSTSFATTAGSANTASTAAGLTGTPTISVNAVNASGIVTGTPGFKFGAGQWFAGWDSSTNLNFDYPQNSTKVQFQSTGTVVNSTGTYGTISDRRIKENIVSAPSYLNKLCQLQVVNYNLIGNSSKFLGFVAQDMEPVLPGLVETAPNKQYGIDDFKSVKTSVLIPMLVQAVQELKAELDAAKAKITALENA